MNMNMSRHGFDMYPQILNDCYRIDCVLWWPLLFFSMETLEVMVAALSDLMWFLHFSADRAYHRPGNSVTKAQHCPHEQNPMSLTFG
jgi:hypothetical protein